MAKEPHRVRLDMAGHQFDALGLRYWPGYEGAFTRDQHPLADIPNKARVVKISSDDPTDAHPPGALGVVLGSIGHPEVGVAYFVEWDDMPGRAVMVRQQKIRRHGP